MTKLEEKKERLEALQYFLLAKKKALKIQYGRTTLKRIMSFDDYVIWMSMGSVGGAARIYAEMDAICVWIKQNT